MSQVTLLEQINVLWHQVFVVLNSHKSSLFLSDLFNCTDVRFLFQYGVGLGLRRQTQAVSFGPTNYEECLHRSEWVSEWHICISESQQQTRFNASRLDEFKKWSKWCNWWNDETMVWLKGKFMTTIIIDIRKLTNKIKTKKLRLTTYRCFLLLMWTCWV